MLALPRLPLLLPRSARDTTLCLWICCCVVTAATYHLSSCCDMSQHELKWYVAAVTTRQQIHRRETRQRSHKAVICSAMQSHEQTAVFGDTILRLSADGGLSGIFHHSREASKNRRCASWMPFIRHSIYGFPGSHLYFLSGVPFLQPDAVKIETHVPAHNNQSRSNHTPPSIV